MMKVGRLWFLVLLALLLVPNPGVAGQRSRKKATTTRAKDRAAASAPATEPVKAAPATTAATPTAAIAPGAAAMRVAIDPETGLPTRLTAEQNRALDAEAAPRRPLPPLTMVRLPDGTMMVRLDDRFLQYTVAVMDSNGRIGTRCVHDAAAAERLTRTSVPSAGASRLAAPRE